jgi:hypothetical protein
MNRGHRSRRRLLAHLASGGTLGALAGCAESDTGTEADTDANGTESEPPAADDLDLREANVVDVGFGATAKSNTEHVQFCSQETRRKKCGTKS